MKKIPRLIVMLTQNDKTVKNAIEIFKQSQSSRALYWGMKEEGIPFEEMKKLYAMMKQAGKKTVLEVVAYSEEECLKGAKIAAECGCDILMGTLFFESVNQFCKEYEIAYMPFIGRVTQRPSVLEGSVKEMVEEAKEYLKKGVFGFDLLGYRYRGNAEQLNEELVNQISAPVCIAGSIDSFERLDQIMKISPWGFTIGGAFFEEKFGTGFLEQVNIVLDYIQTGKIDKIPENRDRNF